MAWVSDSRSAIRGARAGKPGPWRFTAAVRVAALMGAVLIAGGLASAPQAFAASAPALPALPLPPCLPGLPGLPALPCLPGLPTAPGAPTAVTAIAGKASAAVSWTAPASNGGLPVFTYAIIPDPACAGCGGLTATGLSPTSTVTGLTNGQAYTFTVTATNLVGTSPASQPSTPVTPTAPPGAPTAVTATAGNASATVAWTAPVDNGGLPIAGYTIIPNPTCGTCGGLSSTGPSSTVTGLTNGKAYTFAVTATNAAGTSPASAASNAVTPLMAGFTGTAPARVLDTRSGTGTGAPAAKLGASQSLTLTIPNLPTGTTAVAMNVTVTNPTDVSFLTVYPGGGTQPLASNLNYGPNQTVPNMVLVPVGPNNTVTIYNNQGTVDVIADLLGNFE